MDIITFWKAAMVVTFVAALVTLALGVGNLGNKDGAARSNKLMFWRIGLCGLLLSEILVFIFILKPF